jgi:hypothetical protein
VYKNVKDSLCFYALAWFPHPFRVFNLTMTEYQLNVTIGMLLPTCQTLLTPSLENAVLKTLLDGGYKLCMAKGCNELNGAPIYDVVAAVFGTSYVVFPS